MSHGDLPITEISRDNMRDFLDSHLGIDLKWDKVRTILRGVGFIRRLGFSEVFCCM